MINAKYAVKCLKLGFLRYQRYRKLPISVEVSNNTISFYAKKQTMEKGKNARVSDHHLSMQRFAEKNQPWLCDNISIVFIVPNSPEDKSPRAWVYQNAEGSYKEFDVTTYPYNPYLLEPNDISTIFQAIAKYLESGEYIDPFKGTEKEAEPFPRHSNIKPYKGKVKKLGEGLVRLDNALLNEIGQYCVNQYLLLNEYNQNNCNRNMKSNKKVVRLTESQLHNIIAESVSQILMEMNADDYKKAMDNPRYRKMMDKVDPRTYADRANGINAFGRQRNDDLRTMQQGARDSWGRDYGYWNNQGSKFLDTSGNNYKVTQSQKNGDTTTYSPIDNYVRYSNAYDFGNRNDSFHKRQATDKDLSNNQGWEIARHMQNGSNGKGWRNNN